MDRGKWSYVPELDGLRALAILAVAIDHYGPTSLSGGRLGVTTFFVLSGYLVTGLLRAEFQKANRIDRLAF